MKQLADFDTGKLCGVQTDRGYNQATSSGRPFWSFDPQPQDIDIEDIAAHLSRVCRFNGALRDDVEIYTVAQHCCLVSDHCPTGFKLEGLLHDAAEAYCGDLIKPIKMQLPTWKPMELKIEAVIRRKYDLPPVISPEVKEQDYLAVATEHRDVQTLTAFVDWEHLPTPWPEKVIPWSVMKARSEFLNRFRRLTYGQRHAQ